jgi:hypothetical protein
MMINTVCVILQVGAGRSKYAVPYDSTVGVPSYVFIGFWIVIILFLLRLAYEYRDKIFVKKEKKKDR